MSINRRSALKSPTIADLYPDLSEEDQEEAGRNFRAYLELLVRIVERLKAEPGGLERLRALTEKADLRIMKDGSKINNQIDETV